MNENDSKLYNIVRQVVDAKTMEQAESILYGQNGIILNSSEYYQNIVSNFKQKKETIIRKENHTLVFDLNNCNDLWNILFIYNYYIDYIDKQLEEINKQITEVMQEQAELRKQIVLYRKEDKSCVEIGNKLSELTKNVNALKNQQRNYEKYKTEYLQSTVVELENINNIDENQLQEHLQKLKDGIVCIQKIRDSFSHDNNNLNIDKMVTIINEKNKFEIVIPIEYLDGFAKGRIIANDEDKVIVQKTNDIASSLLESLNYDIKQISSFFYNIDPSYLSFLLSQVNYNVDELY